MKTQRFGGTRGVIIQKLFGGKVTGALSINQKEANVAAWFRYATCLLVVFCAAFIVSMTSSTLFMPPQPSEAATGLEVSDTPSMSLTTSDITLGTIDPTAVGAQATNSATVTVTTNNPTGYTVTATSSELETCMRRTSGFATACASLSAADQIASIGSSGSSIPANSWGVSTNSGTTWQPVPAAGSGSPISIASSASPAPSGASASVTAGINVNMNVTAGTYQSTLTYTLLPNTVPAPTITSISPASGAATTALTITGTNFMGVYEVKIGGVDCDNVSIVSTTSITCNAPDGLSGPTAVAATVKTYGGTATGGSFTYPVALSICRNADVNSACAVDIDAKLIPVKYTGSSTTPQWQVANPATVGDWYDYGSQKWANAVAVKTTGCVSTCPTAATAANTIINEADVLGYYVYIPRYAYQVQRSSTTNYAVCGNGTFDVTCSNKNGTAFTIQFQKAADTKLMPYGVTGTGTGTCETYVGSYAACVGNNNTYWTHPAFSFGNDCAVTPSGQVGGNTSCTELNGIWVGKFETSSAAIATTNNAYATNAADTDPVIKPSVFSRRSQTILNQWTTTHTNLPTYQNLTTATTDARLMKNSDWGAVAYLATSAFGRADATSGMEVWINDCYSSTTGALTPRYVTGISGSSVSESYSAGAAPCYSQTTISGIPTANLYYGTIGVHASTTDNAYGIYDLSGGAYEYTLSNYSNGAVGRPSTGSGLTAGTAPTFFTNAANKYFNIYLSTQFTNDSYATNYNQCTLNSCGGHALFETVSVLSVSSNIQSWNSDNSYFVYSSNPWAFRGGYYNNTTSAGLFNSIRSTGASSTGVGSRAVLSRF